MQERFRVFSTFSPSEVTPEKGLKGLGQKGNGRLATERAGKNKLEKR